MALRHAAHRTQVSTHNLRNGFPEGSPGTCPGTLIFLMPSCRHPVVPGPYGQTRPLAWQASDSGSKPSILSDVGAVKSYSEFLACRTGGAQAPPFPRPHPARRLERSWARRGCLHRLSVWKHGSAALFRGRCLRGGRKERRRGKKNGVQGRVGGFVFKARR